MEYLDAALAVLRTSKRPMTTNEITDAALGGGLIAPQGKTPRATMSARLYTYIRDRPAGLLVRIAEPGPTRAKRGSVRWSVRS